MCCCDRLNKEILYTKVHFSHFVVKGKPNWYKDNLNTYIPITLWLALTHPFEDIFNLKVRSVVLWCIDKAQAGLLHPRVPTIMLYQIKIGEHQRYVPRSNISYVHTLRVYLYQLRRVVSPDSRHCTPKHWRLPLLSSSLSLTTSSLKKVIKTQKLFFYSVVPPGG